MKPVRNFFLIILAGLFLSCRTGPPPGEDLFLYPPAGEAVWEDFEYGGLKILKEMDKSLPVGGAAVALDLERIDVVLTGADSSGKGETRSAFTSDFVKSQNIQLGVNGSPFSKVDILNRPGRPMDIIGVQINGRQFVSPPVESLDALYFLDDGRVLMDSQSRVPENTVHGLGGFHLLLKEGAVLGGSHSRHPRTVAGITPDGRTLVLAVFDGRQKNRAGLTTEEAALWMKWLGCSTALNLDGGGSSVMVLKDREGGIHILNSPIHRGRPGLERAVGNHLGIRFRQP